MDLSSLSIDDLLSDLGDRAPARRSLIQTWIDTQGYYPGTDRLAAADLYEIFNDWYSVRPELHEQALPGPTAFGLEMGRHFKRGRGKRGNFYYISRKREAVIPQNLGPGQTR